MSESKQLRLGQIARKLNVGRNTIIDFLRNKGYEIDSNPNTKISSEIYQILENAFEDSAVEKKVASNIKIGLEEKAVLTKEVKKDEGTQKDDKKSEENKSQLKIIKKINLDDPGRKRVASSDQSKKKRRPRKRIISNKTQNKKPQIQVDNKEGKGVAFVRNLPLY